MYGRGEASGLIDEALIAARAGTSGVLVIRGEPGIGKTALLDHAIVIAEGFSLARVVGVESEMELPFAGLQQLCAPMLDRLEELPDPQAGALRAAFGLNTGVARDRLFIGLAVLNLLAAAATESPLLCVVDDAQWLDRASLQALEFVARRLEAESIVLLFGVRTSSEELRGLPQLLLTALTHTDARELLASVMPGRIDERVLDRIVSETHGNPLALIELPQAQTLSALAGGFGPPGELTLTRRIEESFKRRFQPLPVATQRLVMIAAADPLGEPTLVWRAALALGIDRDAAVPAEHCGLVIVGEGIVFRHPLARSAAYRGATAEERRAAHAALASATDPDRDPDLRAWHRAQAAIGPDEQLADELGRSAVRASSRGGLAAAAAFLERSAALTPAIADRAERELAAAQTYHDAGSPASALRLLLAAESAPLRPLQRARLERLRAQIEMHQRRGRGAVPLLVAAAKRLERLDVGLARSTYLDAIGAATIASTLGDGFNVTDVARAARAAPKTAGPSSAADLLLEGFVALFLDGYGTAIGPLRDSLRAFRHEQERDASPLEASSSSELLASMASRVAVEVWDEEVALAISTRQVERARGAGALTALPVGLTSLAGLKVHVGDFAAAEEMLHEAEAITAATGNVRPAWGGLLLAAWRGDARRAASLIEASIEDANVRGEGWQLTAAHYASAVLDNGRGRYSTALESAMGACWDGEQGFTALALPELIEAAIRSDRADIAAEGVRRLSERACLGGTAWALGVEARSRALVSEGAAADALYQEAIAHLSESLAIPQLARTHLLYGEWQRREKRRVEARAQLRLAYQIFVRVGAAGFADRAQRELEATGEHARRRTVETIDDLTAQESQIARLAGKGLSNPEIGSQLFISPRTVEYHLHKIFAKLQISSRHEVARALDSRAEE